MARLNRAQLLGNVGQSPEMHYTESGTAILSFSVATNDGYYDKEDQWVELTTWHRIVMFGDKATKVSEKIGKGTPVYVEGKIRNRSWDDNEGIKRYVTEIVAHSVQSLAKSTDGVPPPSDEDVKDGDDLPF